MHYWDHSFPYNMGCQQNRREIDEATRCAGRKDTRITEYSQHVDYGKCHQDTRVYALLMIHMNYSLHFVDLRDSLAISPLHQ
jgi:hypothetical protein